MGYQQYMVQCADHKFAPCVVVCRHLVSGESREWYPVIVEGQECYDWICPECAKSFGEIPLDDLQAVCMHCVREMQKTATVIHEEPDEE
jgi:hypothetical protein